MIKIYIEKNLSKIQQNHDSSGNMASFPPLEMRLWYFHLLNYSKSGNSEIDYFL